MNKQRIEEKAIRLFVSGTKYGLDMKRCRMIAKAIQQYESEKKNDHSNGSYSK